MKAHIVGGGFGGLAAAALLIRNANVPGQDITIYEADGSWAAGTFSTATRRAATICRAPCSTRNSAARSICSRRSPPLADPKISVRDQFFTFNTPTPTTTRRTSSIATAPSCMVRHFGLGLSDGLALARVSLTPEAMLDGRRIEEFFSRDFFKTEFWLLWSTIMGSLPQHSVIEFRRYMNRFLYLFPHLSTMTGVMRTPFNQHQAFIKPLVAWLAPPRRELRDRRLRARTSASRRRPAASPSTGSTMNRAAPRPRSRSRRRTSCS